MKEIEDAEENISKDSVRLENLVVTLTVEKGDDEAVACEAAEEVKKYLENVMMVYLPCLFGWIILKFV